MTDSPLAIKNFGIRSTFQSRLRPYSSGSSLCTSKCLNNFLLNHITQMIYFTQIIQQRPTKFIHLYAFRQAAVQQVDKHTHKQLFQWLFSRLPLRVWSECFTGHIPCQCQTISVTNGQNCPLHIWGSEPPSNTWNFFVPTRVKIPDGIMIRTATFAGLTDMNDRLCYSACSNMPQLASPAMQPKNHNCHFKTSK